MRRIIVGGIDLKPTNIIVFDEEKFEKWLEQMGIEYEKRDGEYKLKTPIDLGVKIPPGVQIAEIDNSVDANKITDLETKLKAWPIFMLKVRAIPTTATCGGFSVFCSTLQTRLTMGSLKYASSWKHVDLLLELEQELYDVAAYAYLEWLKRRRKITPIAEAELVGIAAAAVVLWQFVQMLREEDNAKRKV